MLIAHISIVFYVEGYRVAEIWERRDNVFGFWSVLGCGMAAVTVRIKKSRIFNLKNNN